MRRIKFDDLWFPFLREKKFYNVERFCIIINPVAFECVRKTKRTLRSLFCARFGD